MIDIPHMTRFFFATAIGVGISGGSAVAGEAHRQLIPGSGTAELCYKGAAQRCIEHVWTHVDQNGDRLLSEAEIGDFVVRVQRWNRNVDQSSLDRIVVRMALAAFRFAGPQKLLDGYDADIDGKLSVTEATADLNIMDERPLVAVLMDEDGVNSETLAARFGFLAPQVVRLARSFGAGLNGNRGAPADIAAIGADNALPVTAAGR